MNKNILLFLCLVVGHVTGAAADNMKDWTRAGFPAMTFVFGHFLIIFSIVQGYFHSGSASGLTKSIGLLIANILTWFWSIFLLFGPGAGNSLLAASAPNTVLAILLIFQICLTFYSSLCQHKPLHILNFALVLFNTLALLGSLSFCSFTVPVWVQDRSSCVTYFSDDLDRCKDDGYLYWLRICGYFAIYTNAAILTKAFMDMTAPAGGYPVANAEGKQALLGIVSNDQSGHDANIGSDVSANYGYQTPVLQPTGSASYTSMGAPSTAVSADTGSSAPVY